MNSPVPPQISFRLIEAKDARPLHTAFYPHKPPLQFKEWFAKMARWGANGRCFWLIGEVDGRLLANGQLLIYPHGAELANLAVVPDERGQGIGAALIAALCAIAQERGLDGVELSVDAQNHRAIALYQQLGFVEDRQVELWGEGTAAVFRKKLTSPRHFESDRDFDSRQ